MGTWGDHQNDIRNKPWTHSLLPELLPIHQNKGRKVARRVRRDCPPPTSWEQLFLIIYRSTLQTPPPGSGSRPRAANGNTATFCTFLQGLVLLAAQLSCLQAAWVDGEVRSKGASLFTLAKSGLAQLTALSESEAQFPSRWRVFPKWSTTRLRCTAPGHDF